MVVTVVITEEKLSSRAAPGIFDGEVGCVAFYVQAHPAGVIADCCVEVGGNVIE